MERPHLSRVLSFCTIRFSLVAAATLACWLPGSAAHSDEPSSRRTARDEAPKETQPLPGPLGFATGYDPDGEKDSAPAEASPAKPQQKSGVLSEPAAPLPAPPAPLPPPVAPKPIDPMAEPVTPLAPPAKLPLEGELPESPACELPEGLDLWLLSSRHVPGAKEPCDGDFLPEVFAYDCTTGWFRSSFEAFLAADDPCVPTMVYVHGNRHPLETSREQGVEAYRKMGKQICSGQRVRFVIWSWPSDPIKGGFRLDAQVKACRTDVDAYYLATVLARIRPDVPVGLVGYSFGARVIAGALHVMAGGQLCGRSLCGWSCVDRLPPRAVLLAPAMDHDVFQPGRQYDLALMYAEKIVYTVNSRDFVLKFYPLMCGKGGPAAMGRNGASGHAAIGCLCEKLLMHDVSHLVHSRHGSSDYLGSDQIMAMVRGEILDGP